MKYLDIFEEITKHNHKITTCDKTKAYVIQLIADKEEKNQATIDGEKVKRFLRTLHDKYIKCSWKKVILFSISFYLNDY